MSSIFEELSKILELYKQNEELYLKMGLHGNSGENGLNEKEQILEKSKRFKGLELSRKYYEAYGRKMIHDRFPAFEERIAVGLCGCGSECFGFDDDISSDHDYGPSFCMWLTDEDYEVIGEALQQAYNQLTESFMGLEPRQDSENGSNRVGVLKISDYFFEHLGRLEPPNRNNVEKWYKLKEADLAAAVSGAVFRDDLGVFSKIRDGYRQYYPENVRRIKLSEAASAMAQNGQYNFIRMLRRGEKVASLMAYTTFISKTIQFLFLIEKEYMPYDKWAFHALQIMLEEHHVENKAEIIVITRLLEAMVDHDAEEQAYGLIEQICEICAGLLQKLKLSETADTNMEEQSRGILSRMRKEERVELILKEEWNMFQVTKNEGGKAECQNDWETFRLMRSGQFLSWPEEILDSYAADLSEAARIGRNLITEKYGRMMESTAPLQYELIKDAFPVLSEERKAIAEHIIQIQVLWLEEFAEEFPKLAKHLRLIHTSEDTPYETSAETYLRGELGTYSEETFILYCQYVVQMVEEEKNLNKIILENSVSAYGYSSLEDAEGRI